MNVRGGCIVVMATLGASLLFVNPAAAQTGDVPPNSLKGQLLNLGTSVVDRDPFYIIATSTSLEVSTAPLGTSTGGFTFTFDPQLRTWKRSAASFGPSFAERGLTTGKAKFSAGFNALHATYSQFSGLDLTNGELKPIVNLRLPAPFQTVSSAALRMNLSSETVVVFGHVGVTDKLDVGVAVPWVRVSLDADVGFLTSAGADVNLPFVPHQGIARTSAAGVGDVAIFGKYRLWRRDDGGLAVAVEARLPTGDQNALRGLNNTRTLVSGIWSKGGRVSPHFNAGYEFWSHGIPVSLQKSSVVVKDMAKYAVGVEFEAHPRATILVDLIGRSLFHGGQVAYMPLEANPGVNASGDALGAIGKGITQLAFAPGIKWNVWNSVLITGNVLASLTTDGLRAKLVPVFGIDWAF